MSEYISLARPYAKAIFELARKAGDYQPWSDQLAFLAVVSADKNMRKAVDNPALSKQQITDLLLAVGKGQLDKHGKNLCKLLVENDRLAALGDINAQFIALRDQTEQVIEAQLISAVKIDAKQKKRITDSLSKRLGKKIKLQVSIDESLIGGAVVRAGDWVVDGSVKAQLQSLASTIAA